jgi:hypothetical protein
MYRTSRGATTAYGGTGYQLGGAGTIVGQASSDSLPDVVIANNASTTGATTAWPTEITAADSVSVVFGASVTGCSLENANQLVLTDGAMLSMSVPITVPSLQILRGAVLTHTAQSTTGLQLTTLADLSIDATSRIDATGRGYTGGAGPGTSGNCNETGGAGHGGRGGSGRQCGGGGTYGSVFSPTTLGSGSWDADSGGPGGGAIRLIVGGVLDLAGSVRANGSTGLNTSGGGGGGAGGSVWITTQTLTGSGSINANGGNCADGNRGGGGGGRIAVYCCDLQLPSTNITVSGGTGYQPGQTGSIYYGSSSIDILSQPGSATFTGGEIVSLTVDAIGEGSLTYRWYFQEQPLFDNDRITGTDTNQLTFQPIDCSDDGAYFCLITDLCGSYPTNPAQITVVASSDYDNSGFVDLDDFIAFVADFELGVDEADFDGSGFVDLDDFIAFVAAFEAGC